MRWYIFLIAVSDYPFQSPPLSGLSIAAFTTIVIACGLVAAIIGFLVYQKRYGKNNVEFEKNKAFYTDYHPRHESSFDGSRSQPSEAVDGPLKEELAVGSQMDKEIQKQYRQLISEYASDPDCTPTTIVCKRAQP